MTNQRNGNVDRADTWEDFYLGPDGTGAFVRCPTPRMSPSQIRAAQRAEDTYRRAIEKKGKKEKWRSSGAARNRFAEEDRAGRVARQSNDVREKIAAWKARLETNE